MTQNIRILYKDSYLALIENSAGSRMFRSLYASVEGEKKDILRDGDLSCAYYVSCILFIFNLVKSPHATVLGLERDLKVSGWEETNDPVPGTVVIWEDARQAHGEMHAHAGFYVNSEMAVSNSDKSKHPITHHPTFGTDDSGRPRRAVRIIYTHPFLHT
jgi:hypothetical protein